MKNRCQAKATLGLISGWSSDGPPKTRAISSTLLRPLARSRPQREPKECSWDSRRPNSGAKRPCNFRKRAAAARSSTVSMTKSS